MGRRKIAGFFELSAQKDNRGGRSPGTKQTLGERPACTQPVNESWVARCLGNFGNMRIADLFDSSRAGVKSVHARMTANGRSQSTTSSRGYRPNRVLARRKRAPL